jgi:DNA-binding transcriptional ArsR family regulator
VTAPLYQLKAEFFRTLGHPARIRALELLSEREWSVGELVPEIGLEASHLSQQLGVLRRAGLVTTRKQGTTVYYSVASPEIVSLLAVARSILTGVLNEHADLLRDLLATNP